MRVEVLERLDGDRVRFRAAGGQAAATWSERPVPGGGVFQVELDVPGKVGWEAIEVDPPAGPGLATSGSTVALTGVVDGLDELGVLTVALPDGYVLVDTEGEPPLGVVGHTVRIRTQEITLTPYSV